MVVVIGIILLIAAMVVPSVTTLWNERKMSETINTAKGMFMTSRVRALDSGGAESGFFVYVDDRGTQRITAIEQPPDELDDPAWQDVFRITPDARDQVLPRPIRVVPRYVADDPTGVSSYAVFDDLELANNSFDSPSASPFDQAQRHRNFFSVIFSTSGALLVNRDVLIQDEDEDGDGLGDRTGLAVGPGPNLGDPAQQPTTEEYYLRTGVTRLFPPSQDGEIEPIEFLVVDPGSGGTPPDVALNFPSVDGLLVYDDALFNELPDPATKRRFLLDTATPLYVSRYTGMVIRGPVGEN